MIKCSVCRRKVIWLRQESGRKALVDSKDQEFREVSEVEIYDPSTHVLHNTNCYAFTTWKRKFVGKR